MPGPGEDRDAAAPGRPAARPWLAPALVVGVVLGVAAVGGGAFLATRAAVRQVLSPQGDAHASMVPAGVDFYVALATDPSGQQKLDLLAMAHKFPSLKTNAEIDNEVARLADAGLKDTGLTYRGDIKPWLGRQVSMAGTVNTATPESSDYAVLAASKDDTAAARALARMRAGAEFKTARWSKRTFDGVEVWSADVPPAGASSPGGAKGSHPTHLEAALVDHSVVLASSAKMMQAIVEAERGKAARLSDSAAFKTAVGKVQADHLAFGYANAHSLAAKAKAAITRSSSDSMFSFSSSADEVKALDAYTGAAFSVSARPDGLEADAWIGVDQAKLPASLRAAYTAPVQPNALARLIPPQAFLAEGATGTKTTVKELQDALAGRGGPDSGLGVAGLSVPATVLSHLGNDVMLEMDKGPGDQYFGGALVLQTDDAAGTRQFLDQMMRLGAVATSNTFGSLSSSLAIGTQVRPATPPAPHRETYKGVSLESLAAADKDLFGLQPAFAVNDGVIVIGSTPAHVREILDQQASTGGGITADPLFDAAVPASSVSNFLYVDIGRVAALLRGALAPKDQAGYDRDAAPNVAVLRAFSLTGTARAGGFTERLVLLAQ